MKLVRIFWKRPSDIFEGLPLEGVFSSTCENEDVDKLIETRKSMCLDEDYGRVITKIQVFTLDKEIITDKLER